MRGQFVRAPAATSDDQRNLTPEDCRPGRAAIDFHRCGHFGVICMTLSAIAARNLRMHRAASLLVPGIALVLNACAAPPTGPSVMALPGQGKNFAAFQQDDVGCRQYAWQQTGGAAPGAAASQSAVGSAVVGTALGAAAGAAIGAASGAAGAGAAIGGATGL